MNYKYTIILMIISFLLPQYANHFIANAKNKNNENNEFTVLNHCYEKVFIPARITIISDLYPIYTGNKDKTKFRSKDIEAIIQRKSVKRVEKKIEKDCIYAHPQDCYEWVNEEIPEITEVFTIVLDTIRTKDFEYRILDVRNLEFASHFAWRRVICDNKIDAALIKNIQSKLRNLGYFPGYGSYMDAKTDEALLQFQKDYDLPYGELDQETLEKLKIDYEAYMD